MRRAHLIFLDMGIPEFTIGTNIIIKKNAKRGCGLSNREATDIIFPPKKILAETQYRPPNEICMYLWLIIPIVAVAIALFSNY